jgi:hypothetical protein
MKCLRNKKHADFTVVCLDCVQSINRTAVEPDLNSLEPEIRALFVAIKTATQEVSGCWLSPQTRYKVNNRYVRAENLYYALYKADINNSILKTTCGNKECVNPSHKKSRYEKPSLNKTVTSGFNRKRTDFTKIPDAQWLREV